MTVTFEQQVEHYRPRVRAGIALLKSEGRLQQLLDSLLRPLTGDDMRSFKWSTEDTQYPGNTPLCGCVLVRTYGSYAEGCEQLLNSRWEDSPAYGFEVNSETDQSLDDDREFELNRERGYNHRYNALAEAWNQELGLRKDA